MEFIDNVIDRIKSIPLVDFLASERIEVNSRGFFAIRDERTPSARVHRDSPYRYIDFGSGRSGDIIDIYKELHPDAPNNAAEVARIIWKRFSNGATTLTPLPTSTTVTTTTSAPISPKYKILWRGEPSFYPLRQYATQRNIPWDIASDLLDEVAFQYVQYDTTKPAVTMRCFGWGSDASLHGRNGYITSAYPSGFKGVLSGRQDITPYNNGADYTVIIEGQFSMLSALCIPELGELRGDWIVLNSVGNVDKAILYCRHRDYKRIGLMLDKDAAGRAATAKIMNTLGDFAVDLNQRYQILRDAPEGSDPNDILRTHPNPDCKSCRCCRFFAWCSGHGYTERGQWTFRGRSCKYYQQI